MENLKLEDVPGIEKITPERYVWHVAPIEKRSLILQNGLVPKLNEHNCIFANNQSTNILFFYPFCLDVFDGTFRDNHLLQYDYWRIDTKDVEANWYIDPNMKNGPQEYMGDEKNFIVTENHIPRKSLELFMVNPRCIEKRMYVVFEGRNKTTNFHEFVGLRSQINEDIKKEINELSIKRTKIRTYTRRYFDINTEKFPLIVSDFIRRVIIVKRYDK
jgi:hypothetical protein